MYLTYVRLNKDFLRDPKFLTIKSRYGKSTHMRCVALWAAALAEGTCTSGLVAKCQLRDFPGYSKKALDALITVGLLDDEGDSCRVHGFADHNKSAERLKQDREDGARRKRESDARKAAANDAVPRKDSMGYLQMTHSGLLERNREIIEEFGPTHALPHTTKSNQINHDQGESKKPDQSINQISRGSSLDQSNFRAAPLPPDDDLMNDECSESLDLAKPTAKAQRVGVITAEQAARDLGAFGNPHIVLDALQWPLTGPAARAYAQALKVIREGTGITHPIPYMLKTYRQRLESAMNPPATQVPTGPRTQQQDPSKRATVPMSEADMVRKAEAEGKYAQLVAERSSPDTARTWTQTILAELAARMAA